MDSAMAKISNLLIGEHKTEPHIDGHQVLGEPCFCLKTRERNSNKKFFVNFCSSGEVKYPALDWDEQKCIEMHQRGSKEFEDYRIPLALKPLCWTQDKKGEDKHFVLDVLVNDKFVEKRVLKSEFFKNFLIMVTIDTVESKYSRINRDILDHTIDIDKESFIVLKNKRYQEQSGFVSKQTSSQTSSTSERKNQPRKIILLDDSRSSPNSEITPDDNKDTPSDSHYRMTYCCKTNILEGIVKCKTKHDNPNVDLNTLKFQINTDHILLTVVDGSQLEEKTIKLLDVYITMLIDVDNKNHSVKYDASTDCLKFNLILCDCY